MSETPDWRPPEGDLAWTVPCRACQAPVGHPCFRRDGSAKSVACGKRWDDYDRAQAAARQQAKADASPAVPSFPAHVTRDQLKAAAEALGLDPNIVTHYQVDAMDGVIVVVLARNADGKALAAGDRSVTMAHRIPIGHDPDGDQA